MVLGFKNVGWASPLLSTTSPSPMDERETLRDRNKNKMRRRKKKKKMESMNWEFLREVRFTAGILLGRAKERESVSF